MPPNEIFGFRLVDVPKVPWPVYRDGSGPPVVLVHEIMGLTLPVFTLARRLVDAGFTVYLPVLGGDVPSTNGFRAGVRICVSREVYALRRGTSPAVSPLRRLAAYAADTAGSGRAGVVGMCFSGGFALAAACDPAVRAAVAAQPSLPFRPPRCAGEFGLDASDVAALRARLASGDTEVYVTRFSHDFISPASRAAAIRRRLGETGVTWDVLDSAPGNAYGFGREHSVLSAAPPKYAAGTPARERLDETFGRVVAFLHRRLG